MEDLFSRFKDNEDCFGFHSEYYIDPRWHGYDRMTTQVTHSTIARKGYATYSKYKDSIYFMHWWKGKLYILNINATDFKLPIPMSTFEEVQKKDVRCPLEDYRYIAVNRQGIYLYNEKFITLFNFGGKEIYTHQFGQQNYTECIYIYDDRVYYSETKKNGTITAICCVNMVQKAQVLKLEIQKDDSTFDRILRNCYKNQYGKELAGFQNPSNAGKASCEFLYANQKRVLAGYTRQESGNSEHLYYIINLDLAEKRWTIFETGTVDMFCAGQKLEHGILEQSHFFSFNMLEDTMWVKLYGDEIRLIQADIQSRTHFQNTMRTGGCTDWILCPLANLSYELDYYYFDGKQAFVPEAYELFRIGKDGTKYKLYSHSYCTTSFLCFDDVYFVDENSEIVFRNPQQQNGIWYELKSSRQDEIVKICKESYEKVFGKKQNQPKESSKAVTLAQFRANAPSMTGYREQLLAYRKSLSNTWDYNAYVGILLGVGGSKHGDSACMNFAIGQGDNGNNTKRTLQAKDLMYVFEKYKGKKTENNFVLLSEVEDEILSIVPEYAPIKRKLHETILA